VLRTAHFAKIKVSTLIVQGTRDPFDRREDVNGDDLPRAARVIRMEEGNHDFMPPKAGSLSHEAHLVAAACRI